MMGDADIAVKGATMSSAWFWTDTKLCRDIAWLFKHYPFEPVSAPHFNTKSNRWRKFSLQILQSVGSLHPTIHVYRIYSHNTEICMGVVYQMFHYPHMLLHL